MPHKDSYLFQVIIDNDLLNGEKYDNIDTDIQKFYESVNIERNINSRNNTENMELKTSSSGLSAGIIIAIIIPSSFV